MILFFFTFTKEKHYEEASERRERMNENLTFSFSHVDQFILQNIY